MFGQIITRLLAQELSYCTITYNLYFMPADLTLLQYYEYPQLQLHQLLSVLIVQYSRPFPFEFSSRRQAEAANDNGAGNAKDQCHFSLLCRSFISRGAAFLLSRIQHNRIVGNTRGLQPAARVTATIESG